LEEPAACLRESTMRSFASACFTICAGRTCFSSGPAQAAPYLWLWTVYCAEAETTFQEGGFRGRIYGESVEHPLAGKRGESFFPTLAQPD